MRRIIIHYHRHDRDYAPWGVWLWPQGYGGRWIPFTERDDFGRIATLEISKEYQRLGFVIRGASWEKDVDQDRFIESFRGDLGEIWLVAGDPTIYLAPPARHRGAIRALGEVELTIHYHRHDGDYEGWNVWIWGEGEPGRSLEFPGQDEYGRFAHTLLTQMTDAAEVGFLLRKSVPGNLWQAQDLCQDRFIPLYFVDQEEKLEIWLLQDDPRLYYLRTDVVTTPALNNAFLEDLQLIRVETYLPVRPNLGKTWGFRLWRRGPDGAAAELALAEVRPCYLKGQSPACFYLKTQRPLDLKLPYEVEHRTHGGLELGYGGVFSNPDFEREFHYSGNDLGVTYAPTGSVFKVWAPTAKNVDVLLYEDDQNPEGRSLALKRVERGVWAGEMAGDLEGRYYNLLVTHGELTEELVDPYARSAGVNGRRGQIVDLSKTNPPGWDQFRWLKLQDPVDAVIYEVHVRDFSSSRDSGIKAKGQYLGVVERGARAGGLKTGLDHLLELGITHVHLLPIFDFATVDERAPASGYNWGYDPLNYNLPEGSYASDPVDGRVRIRELKELILGLNRAGIGAVMDVVYNHTFHSIASNFNKLVPGYFYRLHRDGSFSNGSGCGNELADERSMVRKFIVDSVCYWAREYKLAGFRFDLMGLHSIGTMQAIRLALAQIQPDFLLYGEGWAAGPSTLPETERALQSNTMQLRGIASFCSELRDGVKGHVFDTDQPGFIQGAGGREQVKFGIVGAVKHPQVGFRPWAGAPSQCVSYVEAHDNLTLWDKLLCTTPPGAEFERIKMFKLAQVLVLTSQGIPFLHAGQDFARTKGGDPNSYQSPDQVNQLCWRRKGEFWEIFAYTKGLIELRKARPAFRLRTAEEVRAKLRFLEIPAAHFLGYSLGPHAGGDCYETILVLLNGGPVPVQAQLSGGDWDILADQRGVGPGLGVLSGCWAEVCGHSALILGKGSNDHERKAGFTL